MLIFPENMGLRDRGKVVVQSWVEEGERERVGPIIGGPIVGWCHGE